MSAFSHWLLFPWRAAGFWAPHPRPHPLSISFHAGNFLAAYWNPSDKARGGDMSQAAISTGMIDPTHSSHSPGPQLCPMPYTAPTAMEHQNQ